MRRADRETAFTAFVASRQSHLRRVAYAICGDAHQAEDLLQTAFAKLYVAWPRIQKEGHEDAYCRQIILRAHIDETRRPHRRERAGLDGHDEAAPDGTSYEERSELFDALQALPVMQRKGGRAAALARPVGAGDCDRARHQRGHGEEPLLARAGDAGGGAAAALSPAAGQAGDPVPQGDTDPTRSSRRGRISTSGGRKSLSRRHAAP